MTDTRELVELDNYLRDPSVGLPWEIRIKIADTITALSERRLVLEDALRLIADIETPQAQILLIARAALAGGRG